MKAKLALVIAVAMIAGVCTVDAQEKSSKSKTGAKKGTSQAHDHAHEHELPKKAVATLMPTKGNDVHGVIILNQQGDTCEILGEVQGLTPGKHGFHIHEFGDLRSDDGMSAGAHYNPEGHKHGGPDSKERHVGDLGNITANESGTATVKLRIRGLQVHFVVGRSLVVHAKEDDLKTDPSGESGGRIAVGVIGIASEKPAGSTTTAPTSKGEKKTKS